MCFQRDQEVKADIDKTAHEELCVPLQSQHLILGGVHHRVKQSSLEHVLVEYQHIDESERVQVCEVRQVVETERPHLRVEGWVRDACSLQFHHLDPIQQVCRKVGSQTARLFRSECLGHRKIMIALVTHERRHAFHREK